MCEILNSQRIQKTTKIPNPRKVRVYRIRSNKEIIDSAKFNSVSNDKM